MAALGRTIDGEGDHAAHDVGVCSTALLVQADQVAVLGAVALGIQPHGLCVKIAGEANATMYAPVIPLGLVVGGVTVVGPRHYTAPSVRDSAAQVATIALYEGGAVVHGS